MTALIHGMEMGCVVWCGERRGSCTPRLVCRFGMRGFEIESSTDDQVAFGVVNFEQVMIIPLLSGLLRLTLL